MQHQEATQGIQESHQVLCEEFGRSFCREGDRKRHKCALERQRSIREQHGAVYTVLHVTDGSEVGEAQFIPADHNQN